MCVICLFFRGITFNGVRVLLVLNLDFNPNNVTNLNRLLNNQLNKFNNLRDVVNELRFVPIEPAGSYMPVSFKSFDGGLLNLNFDPFEFDIVKVADSYGNIKMNFAAPGGDLRDNGELETILRDLNEDPIIQRFLSLVGKKSLQEITEILTRRETLMELAEFACMFNAVIEASVDIKTVVIRDGLLRTKKIKSELITRLKMILAQKRVHVRMVGVAKTSKIVFLLKAALICERVFPRDQIGYVEIPLHIENMAYRWSGRGRLGDIPTPLNYAFGTLYVAKLSRRKDLLVTVEIPRAIGDENLIYTNADVAEIMGHLASNSARSYPVLGYPQTLMRAHEFAASYGLPASILRDQIMTDLIKNTDVSLASYIRDAMMLGEVVNKGTLGGRA